MNIADMLRQTGALDAISRELGIDRQQAQTGASALLPALLGGFRKQAQAEAGGGATRGSSPAPGGGLVGLLGGLGGGTLLNAVTSPQPTPREPGNQILGQVFGSKEVSRTVAGQAAQTTGMDPSILKKMLPLLAMAVSGYLASRGGAAAQQTAAPPARRGAGGLLSALDMDGDGNPLDDILGMAGKFRR